MEQLGFGDQSALSCGCRCGPPASFSPVRGGSPEGVQRGRGTHGSLLSPSSRSNGDPGAFCSQCLSLVTFWMESSSLPTPAPRQEQPGQRVSAGGHEGAGRTVLLPPQPVRPCPLHQPCSQLSESLTGTNGDAQRLSALVTHDIHRGRFQKIQFIFAGSYFFNAAWLRIVGATNLEPGQKVSSTESLWIFGGV